MIRNIIADGIGFIVGAFVTLVLWTGAIMWLAGISFQ